MWKLDYVAFPINCMQCVMSISWCLTLVVIYKNSRDRSELLFTIKDISLHYCWLDCINHCSLARLGKVEKNKLSLLTWGYNLWYFALNLVFRKVGWLLSSLIDNAILSIDNLPWYYLFIISLVVICHIVKSQAFYWALYAFS